MILLAKDDLVMSFGVFFVLRRHYYWNVCCSIRSHNTHFIGQHGTFSDSDTIKSESEPFLPFLGLSGVVLFKPDILRGSLIIFVANECLLLTFSHTKLQLVSFVQLNFGY